MGWIMLDSIGGLSMKRSLIPLALFLLLVSIPVVAHHGTNISYDSSKPVTLKGVMTDFNYKNPHPQVFFDVTDESGKVTHWVGEVAPTPFTLSQHGWSRVRPDLPAEASGERRTVLLDLTRCVEDVDQRY